MILGRVVGNVVSTAKHPSYAARTLLVVHPEDPDGGRHGEELVAADGVGAGVGEQVLVIVEGRSAGSVLGARDVPVDAAVVAIVDQLA